MTEDGHPVAGFEQPKRGGKTDPGRAAADNRNMRAAVGAHAA
ncbi:hypothetical protein FHX14_002855 [Rhizobium sp. BK619]|nr:hypothetical protein [Rhizobium sp. BK619]